MLNGRPEVYKLNPLYFEARSERLHLLIKPSLKEKIKMKAAKDGKSMNDEIHSILEAVLEYERSAI